MMNLTYRGIAYEVSSPVVEATSLPETATFLGARCHRKQYTVVNRSLPASELTYRGVRYSH